MDGIMKELVHEVVSTEVFAVWFLIGAALVFWMQAGFAMVEAGFTRAKNTGNIIMKNLMDFCIGTVVFILIGFGLLMGEDLFGFIGRPGFDLFTSYAEFDFSSFVFNLVFCATTATIVSGAMAERTKFLSYCIYSGVISALIYKKEYAKLNEQIRENLLNPDYIAIYDYIKNEYDNGRLPIVSKLFDMFDVENSKDIYDIVNFVFVAGNDNEKYYEDCVKIIIKSGLSLQKESLLFKLSKTKDNDERKQLMLQIQQIILKEKNK